MKISRGVLIWATLALCGVMVLGAMTWLTRGVLASEKERAVAEARADLEERTRLALWRMDALGAVIVAGENRHTPADYGAGSAAFPTPGDPVVKLHFELRQSGKLTSPETESGQPSKLVALRDLLRKSPIPGEEWSQLTCAAEAGETAWNAVPKQALQQKFDNQMLRQTKGGSQVRGDASYQSNSSGTELAQRAKTVEETVISSNIGNQIDLTQSPIRADANQILDLGVMRAVWVGDELLLLRQFTTTSSGVVEKGIQGVWFDREILKQRLLAEIKDLLPASNLAVVGSGPGASRDPLTLVSFPLGLLRNESAPAADFPLNGPLIIGWAAVLLALLTASLLVHGVMRLSERRASFVSAVTHELRTPLTTFRLYSDMLESGAVKEGKRGDYLRVLSREADRLSHLVENVLSFSKVERGSARSVVRETSVAGLLEPMRERLEARLATAGLTLEMDGTGESKVRVDSAAVEHILFNLIDNAAKYAANGEPPKVEIRSVTSGRFLEITVSDHGPGIPESERGRIFRAFHKSAREAAESRPGVGLGLALSRRLAKSLGGGLTCVDSKSGACFVLRLPLVVS
ncbi:MAG: HAMP domain-containing sensor histidine kinase [Luteolibacter sp.]|uniref:sensor histidine kinase n=1 Tax=Luteolibacter sp. TaxID=1962973 RepID=UPI003263FF89